MNLVSELSMIPIDKAILDQIVFGSLFSKSRDKLLRETKSFSTNFLIKLYYKLKELKMTEHENLKAFIESIKPQVLEKGAGSIIIEESGYLTFVNTEKDDDHLVYKSEQKQSKKPKTVKEEEKKKEVKIADD